VYVLVLAFIPIEDTLKLVDETFSVLLQQRRRHLILLKSHWANRFTPTEQFDNHVARAASIARTLSGPINAPRQVITVPIFSQVEEEDLDPSDVNVPPDPDTDETLLVDIVSMDLSNEEEPTDSNTGASECSVNLIWRVPVRPSSFAFVVPSDKRLLQDKLYIHDDFRQEILTFTTISHNNSTAARIFHGTDNLSSIQFDPSDIARLKSPTAWLNDTCINGGAALLQWFFSSPGYPGFESSRRCALLSTFDLPRVRYKADDDQLWRHISRTLYWQKDVWIVPIHRTNPHEHWVLCVASLRTYELFLFDSLGSKRQWRRDTKVCLAQLNTTQLICSRTLCVLPSEWFCLQTAMARLSIY